MKNQKVKYVLIPAVLVVWGLIAFRLFSAMSGDEGLVHVGVTAAQVADLAVASDTFEIANDYSDPFLDRSIISMGELQASNSGEATRPATAPQRNVKPEPVKTEPVVRWPQVVYKGRVTGQDRKIGVWEVGNKSGLVREGDILLDVTMVKMWQDSATVRFNNENRTARLNQPLDIAAK